MSPRAVTLVVLFLVCAIVGGLAPIAAADCVDTPLTVTFDAGSGMPHCYSEAGMTVCAYQAYPPFGAFDSALTLGDNDSNTSPDLANFTISSGTLVYKFTMGGAPFTVTSFDFVHFSGTHYFLSPKGGFSLNASEAVMPDPEDWSGITSFEWYVGGGGNPGGVIDNLAMVKQCCGNGVVDTGEQCDDGNTLGNDDDGGCCSATCQFEASGTPCPADGNFCTVDACDGAGTCHYAALPNCDVSRPCGPIRPAGNSTFEHPKKASLFKSSLVQGFVPCGNPGGNNPDHATEGGIPACSAETPNERAGSPSDGWQWDETKGKGDVMLKSICPGADDVSVQLKLSGVVDGTGAPANGDGALRLTVRATLDDPTGDDMEAVSISGQLAVTLLNGKGALRTTAGVMLTENGMPDFPNGTSLEVLDVQVLDPNGNLFAHPGVFLP